MTWFKTPQDKLQTLPYPLPGTPPPGFVLKGPTHYQKGSNNHVFDIFLFTKIIHMYSYVQWYSEASLCHTKICIFIRVLPFEVENEKNRSAKEDREGKKKRSAINVRVT